MKHDNIVDNLERRLNRLHPMYNIISKEEYDIGLGHGECDVYMITPIEAIAFEVKTKDTTQNRTKAEHQLYKDNRYFDEEYNITNTQSYYAFSDNSRRRGYDVVKIGEYND